MQKSRAMMGVGLGLLLVVISLAVFAVWKQLSRSRQSQPISEFTPAFSPLPRPRFAELTLRKTSYTPVLDSQPVKLSQLSNLAAFERTQPLSARQRQFLQSHSFVVVPNTDQFYSPNADDPTMRSDDWTGLYQTLGGGPIFARAPENSVFISSDLLLHVFHRLVAKEVEYVEQTSLAPKLSQLSSQLLQAAARQRDQAGTPTDRASYERLTTYFAVPTAILATVRGDIQNQVTGDSVNDNLIAAEAELDQLKPYLSETAYQRARAELRLIFDRQQQAVPPLWAEVHETENLALLEDYTQYTPRGRYTKNAVLRAYFRSMIWYGRTTFLARSPSLTRDALHLTQLMAEPAHQQLWDQIYLPTSFLIGESDDLQWRQYQQVLNRAEINSPQISERQLQNAQLLISLLPKPQVMSSVVIDPTVTQKTKAELQAETQGLRLFGQRVTADAFIFTTLTQGQELPDAATGQRLPSTTSSLLVMSALGSSTADTFVPSWITTTAPDADQVLNQRLSALRSHFQQLSDQDWTQNLYWSWLFTLRATFTNYESLSGFPAFMRSPEWKIKNLQTGLGSWTELKHDSVLYAKQSYAELGAGGDEQLPPVPLGYVEPNIPLLDRLIALSEMTRSGLDAVDALPQEFAGRHQAFEEAVSFLRQLAVKQLENQAISDDEFERLRTIGGVLDQVIRPLPNEQSSESLARAAIITDVHTDAVNGEILYQATGIPDYIYVAVTDRHGSRLTKGLVYRHYEFVGPLTERQTNEQWQARNYPPGNLPERPFWLRSLQVP